MHLLVTGGAGFIGFHLIQRLLKEGHTVVSVDSVTPYYDVSLKEARLASLKDWQGYQFERISILDAPAMKAIFEQNKFDRIIHLAAIAGVTYAMEHGDEYIETNVQGTFALFEYARKAGVKKIIYASSSSVYGDGNTMPFSEDQETRRQASLYGVTKMANELTAYHFSRNFGIASVGLRFFTVYGPWGRPDMALFLFTNAIVQGKPLEVRNQGKMFRDWTYVEDIVDGIVRCLDYDTSYDVLNLGRGEQFSLMDFIKEIENNLDMKAKLNMIGMPPGEVPATLADITKARNAIGYNPRISVPEGIKRFIEWYREYYSH